MTKARPVSAAARHAHIVLPSAPFYDYGVQLEPVRRSFMARFSVLITTRVAHECVMTIRPTRVTPRPALRPTYPPQPAR